MTICNLLVACQACAVCGTRSASMRCSAHERSGLLRPQKSPEACAQRWPQARHQRRRSQGCRGTGDPAHAGHLRSRAPSRRRRDGAPRTSLWWSGVAAGLSISFSLLAQAILRTHLPDAPWQPLLTSFGYCVGFIMAVLSRQQLFTESTITAVLPVVAEFTWKNIGSMARLWAIVLAANLAGTLFAALFCTYTPVLPGANLQWHGDDQPRSARFQLVGDALSRHRRRFSDGRHGLADAGRRSARNSTSSR